MVRLELIDKKMIVSPTARQFYRACAIISLVMFLGVMRLLFYGAPEIIAPVLRPLLFLGALCVAAVQVGMEIFLFRYDNSHPFKQVFWFCVLVIPFLGSALYCFMVYSRSDAVKSAEKPKEMVPM